MSHVAHLKDMARGALARAGYAFERVPAAGRLHRTHPDLEPEFASLYKRCSPFTMTSVERMYALWQSVGHVVRGGVAGDLVECGVWRGGSSMLAALTLAQAGDPDRTMWLYDTFEGMSEPDERDVAVTGARMVDEWAGHRGRSDDPVFAFGALDEVRRNMLATGHRPERVRFVRGKVEDTIPGEAPDRIALLRLDTDWYASTRHELEHLYPRLAPGGVLIVDDYGHWAGARQAIDEFLDSLASPPLLTRIDYTGRIGVKP
jgi:O-methyltransferase